MKIRCPHFTTNDAKPPEDQRQCSVCADLEEATGHLEQVITRYPSPSVGKFLTRVRREHG